VIGIDVCLYAAVSQPCLHKEVQIYTKAEENILELCVVFIQSLTKQVLPKLSVYGLDGLPILPNVDEGCRHFYGWVVVRGWMSF